MNGIQLISQFPVNQSENKRHNLEMKWNEMKWNEMNE